MKKTSPYLSNQILNYFKGLIILLLTGLLSAKSSAAAPTISSFSPASGAIGSSVTIAGSGFNATAAQNIVFFGATRATVTAASTSSLTVTVPTGATYQYISVTNLANNLTAYSAKPFIVTLAGNISFAAKQDFTPGTSPVLVSIGDIDGDGKPDVAVANLNSNSVSVFRNTSVSGTVSFAAKQDFTTGTAPQSVSIGDIDGDGKPDVVTANENVNTVSVLRNTSTSGTISFAAKVDFATSVSPYSVIIGDIDGDGKPDVVTTNNPSATVSVLRNTSTSGTVSFAAKVDFATGAAPFWVSAGDIDGDGKPDLVVANYSGNSVSVLRNTSTSGTISFAAKVDFTTGIGPQAVSIGDLDGDGKLDIVASNSNDNSVSVLRNTSSSGTVSFAAKVDFTTGSSPNSIGIGDIDGDGKPDLAVANVNSNTVSVLRNTSTSGAISFAAKVDFTAGANPFTLSVGDLDGDGKPDLVVCNYSSNTISVLRQTIPVPTISSFSPASGAIGSSVTITGTGFNATAAQNIVFFGATRATVTAASTTSLTVTVPAGATYQYISVTNLAVNLTAYSAKPFIVTLSGSIAFAPKQDFATGSNPQASAIGDIDGDGKPDVVVGNVTGNSVSVFRNTSTSGTLSFAAKADFATGSDPYAISIGDIDGDGKPDLVIANESSNTVSVLRNTSTSGNVSFAGRVDFTVGIQPEGLSIGDIDGDGKPDLATANSNFSSGTTVSVLLNTSTVGAISFAAKTDFTVGSTPDGLSFGDIDGDGKTDMVVANGGSGTVSVLRNTSTTGTVSFAARVDFTTTASPFSVSIGDIDGDGKPDLAAATYSGHGVSVLRNTSTSGSVSFDAKVDFYVGASSAAVCLGDIDGDGKPDMVSANNDNATVSVFRNTSASGTISFASRVDYATGSNPWVVSIGDIDGDGKPDIVVPNQLSNTVTIIRQVSLVPAITSFSPASGAIGSSVTITGTGFNATAAQNIVFFGATRATVTAANATSLTVTVPAGATYQYISVTNLAVNLTAYSVKPFIVTLAGNIAFANKQDFTASTNPYFVSIGDIDVDGKPDLVVANIGTNAVSVLRNTSSSGTVSFAAKTDFVTGTSPTSVSIGDIDGDGKPDLAVANSNSASVSVLRNTSTSGTVSFAAKVDFTTGSFPQSISIGDIDGDGKPDLAVANNGSTTVSVFRNTSSSGTVSFAAKVDFTTTSAPYWVSIGDIDGDGKPDLAVANLTSNTVSVFRNTSASGAVNFAAKVDFTTGSSPSSVAIGDIDGDGKPDLVVADDNSSTNKVSILRNTSTSGTVSFAAKVDFSTGSSPLSVSIGDIDGDGKPDLAVANQTSNTISVLRNTSTSGTVSFATKVDFATGTNPTSVSIGDIDGDGKPDLAVANEPGSTTISVIQQSLIPTITSFTPASGAIGSSVTITGSSFNTTANQNIVFFGATQATVTAASSTSLTVTVPAGATYQYISVTNLAVNLTAYSAKPFIVTLAGNIAFANKQDFTAGTNPRSVSIGDIDGDGKPDLVVANFSSTTLSVFRNTSSSGTVNLAAKVDLTTGTGPWSVCIGDIDGDGKPDLAAANFNSNTVSVFLNTSTPGTVSFATKVDFAAGTGPKSVSIGDIDGDGKPDLAVVNENSTTVSVFRNTSTFGTVSFSAKVDFATNASLPWSVSIGDIDGDGKPDLAVGYFQNTVVSVFRNTSTSGAVNFAVKVDFTTGTSPFAISIGDIDGDGKPDLAVANNSSNTVSVLLSTSTPGTVSFATKVDFTAGSGTWSVSAGDIDGDGKPDLAVANQNSNTVSLLRNTSITGSVSFAAKVDFATSNGPASVSIGDIDGDGKPDLATANQVNGSNTISVIQQVVPLATATISGGGTVCANVNLPNVNIALIGTAPWALTYAINGVNQTPVTSIVSSPYVFAGTSAGTYTVTAFSDSSTTGTSFGSATITVNALPTIIVNSPALCQGSTTNLTAAGGTSYVWSPATRLSATTGSSVICSATTTTVYTVTGTNSNGCSSTATSTVSVNPLPTITANTDTICRGSTTILSAAGGVSYVWSPATGLSATTGSPVTCSATTTTIYTVTGTNSNGCSSTATSRVTVSFPTITVNSPSVCSGLTTTITAVGGVSYVWNPATGLSSTTGSPVTFNGTNTTTYTVTGSDAKGCSSTAISTVTVNAKPNVASNSPTICSGTPATLTASGASSYSWSPAIFLNTTTGASVTANATTTTVYTVTGTGSGGCSNTNTSTVTVNPIPTITTNSPLTICSGQTVTLTAGGASTYSWSTGEITSSISVTLSSATTLTTTYTVTGSSGGCSGTAIATVNVTPLPVINVSPNITLCIGASSNLTAGGGTSYQWNPATGLNTSTGSAVTVTPSVSGSVTYTVTGSVNGCASNSATVTVTTLAQPAVTASPTLSVCLGSSGTLTAGGTAVIFSWSPGTGLSSTSGSSVVATPVNSGTTTYTVTGTSASGCTASATASVSAFPLPLINASPVSTCFGTNASLSASGALSYSWSPSATLLSSSGSSVISNATASTFYLVTGTDANGCISTKSVALTVNPLPTMVVNSRSICSGSVATLTANGPGNYSWSTGASTQSISVSPTVTTTYSVSGTDGNGCVNTAVSTVTANALPVITASAPGSYCNGVVTTLTATGATTYSWSGPTALTPSTGSSVTASPTGTAGTTYTYTVTGTDAHGCSGFTTTSISISTNTPTITVNPAGASYCSGSSLSLTTSGASTYVWSGNASAMALLNVANSPVVVHAGTNTSTANITYTYTVTGTNSFGCSASVTKTVQVKFIDPFSVNSATICNSGSASATITVTPAFAYTGQATYKWSSGGTTVIASCISTSGGTCSASFSPTTTTTYTIANTQSLGATTCKADTQYATIFVVSAPVVSISSSATALCGAASSLTLSANGASSYLWDSGATTTTLSVSPTVTTVYTVTGLLSGGCSSTATYTVAPSQPLPGVTTTPPATICAGSAIALTAAGSGGTGPYTYTWTPSLSLSSTTGSAITASPTVSQTYTVKVTDGYGCTQAATVPVTANPLPALAVNSPTTCSGKPTSLSVSGGNSYLWSTGETTTTISVSPAIATTYTVTGTGVNGCTNAASSTVSIYPLTTITTSPAVTICYGSSAVLTAGGAISYSWSPATNLSSTSGSSVTTNTSAFSVYTVTGTDGNGCSGSATVTVVPDLPSISASPSSTLCGTQSVILTASGGATYNWSSSSTPSGLSSTFGSPVTATPTATTTYIVIGTDDNGCTNTAILSLIVNANPVINANGPAAICSGASAVLTASGTATSYLWSTGVTTQTISVSPTSTTTYSVRGTASGGCSATATVTLVVNPLPTINTSPLSTCKGSAVSLSASGANTYAWSPAGAISGSVTGSTVNTVFLNTTGTTTYTVTGTDASGCSSVSTLAVTVNDLPQITITPASLSSYCSASSTTLTANGAVNYLWSPPTGLSSTIGSVVTHSLTNTTSANITLTYTVIGTNANGCSSSATKQVTVKPIPSILATPSATICSGNSATLTVNGSLSTSYLWSWSTGSTCTSVGNGASCSVTLSPSTTTTYSVFMKASPICPINQLPSSPALATINVIQPVTIQASSSTVCNGIPVTLTASGGQTTYTWSPATGLSSTTGSVVSANPTTTSAYTVTGFTTAPACTSSASVTLIVPSITALSNSPVCSGGTLNLSSGGSINYSWTGPQGFTSSDQYPSVSFFNAGKAGSYTVTATDANGCTAVASTEVSVASCPQVLNVTLFLQGYYKNPGSATPMDNLGGGGCLYINFISADATEADSITLCLVDSSTLIAAACNTAILKTNGSVSLSFPSTVSGNSYYLKVTHRNAVETWSKFTLPINLLTTYDFSSGNTQAYGDNEVEMEPGVWAFYSGDVSDGFSSGNQDGVVESSDYSESENALTLFLSGYIEADLTGDGLVTIEDYSLMQQNVYLTVHAMHP